MESGTNKEWKKEENMKKKEETSVNRYIGLLIRQKRMEQNLSQEGLCRGICVVSYLSKIEQGKVNPGIEIVEQLFAVLGITFVTDEGKIEQLQQLLHEYFDCFFHGEDTEEIVEKIEKEQSYYENSELNLSWQLFGIYRMVKLGEENFLEETEQRLFELSKLEKYMTKNQLFLLGILMGNNQNLSFEQRMHWFQVAGQQIAGSYVLTQQGHLCFKEGKYLEAVHYLEIAYQMAAEEGNANILVDSSFLIATCFSNYDIENMKRYYRRTIELARTIRPELMYSIYYNMGATYVEYGYYEEAVENLRKVEQLLTEHDPQKQEGIDWLLLYHKLAFSYIQLGRKDLGKKYLYEAKECIDENTNETILKMLRVIELRLQDDYLEQAEYENLLKEVYETAGKTLGYGFTIYHGRYLVELYKAKRRYKEALEITEKLNGKINFPEINE